MTTIRPLKSFTVALALAFVTPVAVATAQVTITYGNPSQSSPNYRVPGYSVQSSPYYNGYSYAPSPGIVYQQVPQQFGVQGGQYRSGFRGNYTTPYPAYRQSYTTPYPAYRQSHTTPYQTYQPSQAPVYYGNQLNANQYYGNGYNGTQSQQRGAVIGGTIGSAIGGQRSGNIGAAIGAAIGRQ